MIHYVLERQNLSFGGVCLVDVELTNLRSKFKSNLA